MLTFEQFDDLQVGDVIEAGELMPSLSGEPLVWEVNEVNGQTVNFHVSYHGVFVTWMYARRGRRGLKWGVA